MEYNPGDISEVEPSDHSEVEALGKVMIGLQANVNYHNVAMGQGQEPDRGLTCWMHQHISALSNKYWLTGCVEKPGADSYKHQMLLFHIFSIATQIYDSNDHLI